MENCVTHVVWNISNHSKLVIINNTICLISTSNCAMPIVPRTSTQSERSFECTFQASSYPKWLTHNPLVKSAAEKCFGAQMHHQLALSLEFPQMFFDVGSIISSFCTDWGASRKYENGHEFVDSCKVWKINLTPHTGMWLTFSLVTYIAASQCLKHIFMTGTGISCLRSQIHHHEIALAESRVVTCYQQVTLSVSFRHA